MSTFIDGWALQLYALYKIVNLAPITTQPSWLLEINS